MAVSSTTPTRHTGGIDGLWACTSGSTRAIRRNETGFWCAPRRVRKPMTRPSRCATDLAAVAGREERLGGVPFPPDLGVAA